LSKLFAPSGYGCHHRCKRVLRERLGASPGFACRPAARHWSRRLGRRFLTGLLILFSVSSSVSAAQQPTLAYLIPKRCHLFIEVHELSSLYAQLSEAGVWSALTALQGSGPQTAIGWQDRLETMLGVPWPEIIDTILGQQLAVAAADPDVLDDVVVLARVPDTATVARLLGAQDAQVGQRVGAVQCYQVGPMQMGVLGNLVIFGPTAADASRLFHETVTMAAGRGHDSLASDPGFLRHTRRLQYAYKGLVYLDTRRPPTGSPEVARRWPASRFTPLAAGFRWSPAGLEVQFALDGVPQTSPSPLIRPAQAAKLPADTLAVVGLNVDYARLFRQWMGDDRDARAARYSALLQAMLGPENLREQVLGNLGSETLLIVSPAGRSVRTATQPAAAPSVAVMILTGNRQAVETALNRLGQSLVALLNVHAMRRGLPTTFDVGVTTYREATIRSIDLGALLSRSQGAAVLGEVEIAWTGIDRWLVIATRSRHVRNIVDSLTGATTGWGEADPTLLSAPFKQCHQYVLGHPNQLADALQRWVDRIQQARTPAEDADRPSRDETGASRRVELGAAVKPDPARPGAVMVVRILKGWPADGFLKEGDRILAVNGQPLSPDAPIADLRRAVQHAADDVVMVLDVQRGGEVVDQVVPLPAPPEQRAASPSLGPAEALRRIAALCKPFSAIGLWAAQQPDGRTRAVVSLRFAQP